MQRNTHTVIVDMVKASGRKGFQCNSQSESCNLKSPSIFRTDWLHFVVSRLHDKLRFFVLLTPRANYNNDDNNDASEQELTCFTDICNYKWLKTQALCVVLYSMHHDVTLRYINETFKRGYTH